MMAVKGVVIDETVCHTVHEGEGSMTEDNTPSLMRVYRVLKAAVINKSTPMNL